jgi:Mg2+ and Co2+ transporter CorA
MNTAVPFEGTIWGFWVVLVISILAALAAFIVLWKKKMF